MIISPKGEIVCSNGIFTNPKTLIMETLEKPKLTLLQTGNVFKVLKVKGFKGMIMPPHHATKEAVIVVQKGDALLKMPNANHSLKAGSTFVIPTGVEHSLEILNDFDALAIMAVDCEIKFC